MRGGLSRISLIVYSARTLTVRFYFAARRKDIIRTMESFNNNLQGGKKLVKSLEKQTPVSVLQAPATPAVLAAGGDDQPALLVGSAMSQAGARVIKPVES